MFRATSLLAIALAAITTSGCATLFGGKKSALAMQSVPPEAEVYLNGNRVGSTPFTMDLEKKKEYTVTFKHAGYKDATSLVGTKVGAGWIILDVLGGIVPVVIDAATGDWKGLDTHVVNVTMEPDATAVPNNVSK